MKFLVLFLSLFILITPSLAQPVTGTKTAEGTVVALHVLRGLASYYQVREKHDIPPLPRGTELPKVEYIDPLQSSSIQVRVENMVGGIIIDVPPEYDPYSYEIRRLMARVEDPEIYTDDERLASELNNVGNASLVLDEWRDALEKERDEIEGIIEEKGASSNVYRSLKYNKNVIDAFLIETEAWLEHNYALLDFLLQRRDGYVVKDNILVFAEGEEAAYFVESYLARQKAIERMRRYSTFRGIIH